MQLGTQLISAALLIVLMTLVHGVGIVAITKLLQLEDERLQAYELGLSAFSLMVTMALCLFGLHILEIGLFAAFYLLVSAVQTAEEALFFSASAYATIGHTRDLLTEQWRVVGAIEGLVGFVLIGWSTAVFVTDMNKLLRK